jgi:hypothetical protein
LSLPNHLAIDRLWAEPLAPLSSFSPGRVPGRPAHAAAFANKLNRHGIKITAVRNTARITLALDLPAAVLADLFDMHINTAVRWVHRAKRDWSSYIAARAEDLNPNWRDVPSRRIGQSFDD